MNQRPLNRVMVAEDSNTERAILCDRLRDAGYDVRAVKDGQEAIDRLREDPPNILITDWQMPHVDGLELCRRVRAAELPDYVYIVVVTGRSDGSDLIAAMNAGADDFLTKPVRKDQLLARLKSVSRVLELQDRLTKLANLDVLTNLPTRRIFNEALDREWKRSHRYQKKLACVMFDIDHFKQVNDVHGHPAGDLVIQMCASLLQETCRETDIPCRYGGEEFCVLLPDTDEQEAVQFAERLRKKIGTTPVRSGDTEISVSSSFGIAEAISEMDSMNALVEVADECLLEAKERGRDCCVSMRDLKERDPTIDDRSQLSGAIARDAMLPLFHSVRPQQSVAETVSYFLQHRVSSAPVTDEKGQLIGIVSEGDILEIAQQPEADTRSIAEIMHPKVIAYEEETPLDLVLNFMRRAHMHHVVVTSGGQATGIISRGAALRLIRGRYWTQASSRSAQTFHPERRIAQHLKEHAARLEAVLDGQDDLNRSAAILAEASHLEGLVEELLATGTTGNELTAATDGMVAGIWN